MIELISRESLLKKYDAEHKGEPGRARRLIEAEPTIEEWKVGRWIDIPHTFFCKCSECGWTNDHDSGFKWCPDCDAMMMRGEEHESD